MPETRLVPLAAAVRELPPSGIRDLANAAAEIPGAIRLDLGQPMFPTPPHIAEAAKAAIEAGFTQYTQTLGTPSLREAVREKLVRVNDLDLKHVDVACTSGGVGAVAAAMAAVLSAGDEVLIPDPAWPNYRMICAWLGARPVPYPCPAANGFEPDVEQLTRLAGPRTRMLVVNSPNNPTGAVYDPSTLEALARFAHDRELALLSDECYDEIRFDGSTLGLCKIAEGQPGLISVFTCSKTYAMTGWRLGYLAAHPEVVTGIGKVLESYSSCPSSISQAAAEVALRGPQECVVDMVRGYRERRDLVVGELAGTDLLLHAPEGAFYAMIGTAGAGVSSREFAFGLLREHRVSVAPGSAFGSVDDAVRISTAGSPGDLSEGISRLRQYTTTLEGHKA